MPTESWDGMLRISQASRLPRNASNLDEVVAVSVKLDSIERTGEQSDRESSEGGEFENIRGICAVEITQIDGARQAVFRLAVAECEKN